MRCRSSRRLCLAGAGPAALAALGVAGAVGQSTDQLRISVAPTIVAAPRSEVAFPIRIDAPKALPKKGFINVLGLPTGVSLTEGHLLSPGSWAVPFARVSSIRVGAPDGVVAGRSEIVIRLIAMDGRLLAQASTVLIVEAGATGAAATSAPPSDLLAAPALPANVPEGRKAPVSSPAPLAAEEQRRAQQALARGEEYFSRGSILVARQYFQHAADAGLAEGALRLAATYDPEELQHILATGVVPDRDLARRWYERARELGATEAEERLTRLDSR